MNKSIKYNCHTGGAIGSDSYFEKISLEYNILVNAYSYKTKHHKSSSKKELTHQEFLEGKLEVEKANKTLNRLHINNHIKLLARNWFQVKYSEEVFAIGFFDRFKNIKGGTAWAVEMAKNNRLKIYFFDQNTMQWFAFDYTLDVFKPCYNEVKITATNFTGIGTRNLNLFGIEAIENLFKNSFTQKVLTKTA